MKTAMIWRVVQELDRTCQGRNLALGRGKSGRIHWTSVDWQPNNRSKILSTLRVQAVTSWAKPSSQLEQPKPQPQRHSKQLVGQLPDVSPLATADLANMMRVQHPKLTAWCRMAAVAAGHPFHTSIFGLFEGVSRKRWTGHSSGSQRIVLAVQVAHLCQA